LKDVPDIRQGRVDDILGSMNAGSYNVSGRDVADKVINSVFDRKA
jgi:anti-sigma28 factor (negative regulator of flagellin synthesis)